jgi:uncharacterized membrane protein YbaN (DUF454 family)
LLKIVGKQIAAYVCLLVGVAGLLLPLLPGIPFLLIGMKLLGPDHPITRPIVSLVRRFRDRRKAKSNI